MKIYRIRPIDWIKFDESLDRRKITVYLGLSHYIKIEEDDKNTIMWYICVTGGIVLEYGRASTVSELKRSCQRTWNKMVSRLLDEVEDEI